jgi:hypothetical protein
MAPREPFGMFYVMVDPNSKFEKLLGIATMAPYFVICTLVVLVARCRELMTITWLVGQLGNEVCLLCSCRNSYVLMLCGVYAEGKLPTYY